MSLPPVQQGQGARSTFSCKAGSIAMSLLLLVLAFAAGGCATDEKTEAEHAGSTLPWNRPAKWEGPGVMGSMMQGSQ